MQKLILIINNNIYALLPAVFAGIFFISFLMVENQAFALSSEDNERIYQIEKTYNDIKNAPPSQPVNKIFNVAFYSEKEGVIVPFANYHPENGWSLLNRNNIMDFSYSKWFFPDRRSVALGNVSTYQFYCSEVVGYPITETGKSSGYSLLFDGIVFDRPVQTLHLYDVRKQGVDSNKILQENNLVNNLRGGETYVKYRRLNYIQTKNAIYVITQIHGYEGESVEVWEISPRRGKEILRFFIGGC